MQATSQLTRRQFASWLDRYGQAWERGDPEAAVALFAAEARYYETPFASPMTGHEAICTYWQAGASDSQQDVRFTYQILSVSGETGLARWQAEFRRVPSGVQVSLDGVLQATFDDQGCCTIFREWWHRREQ